MMQVIKPSPSKPSTQTHSLSLNIPLSPDTVSTCTCTLACSTSTCRITLHERHYTRCYTRCSDGWPYLFIDFTHPLPSPSSIHHTTFLSHLTCPMNSRLAVKVRHSGSGSFSTMYLILLWNSVSTASMSLKTNLLFRSVL